MDSKALRFFLQVAELGNLSRAAARLHITQPALSRQIKQLEADLATQLFARTGRGLKLTAAGELLARRARPIVHELDALATEVTAQAERVTGAVAVAVSPSIGVDLAVDVIEDFRAQYPAVEIRVVAALSGAVRSGLIRGLFDLGILPQPAQTSQLALERLWSDDVYLIGPASSGLKPSEPTRMTDALALPLILPSRDHGLRALVDGSAARHGRSPHIVLEADSRAFIVEFVRRGAGYTMLPQNTVAAELKAELLCASKIIAPVLRRHMYLAHVEARPLSRAATLMADMLRAGATRARRRGSAAAETSNLA